MLPIVPKETVKDGWGIEGCSNKATDVRNDECVLGFVGGW